MSNYCVKGYNVKFWLYGHFGGCSLWLWFVLNRIVLLYSDRCFYYCVHPIYMGGLNNRNTSLYNAIQFFQQVFLNLFLQRTLWIDKWVVKTWVFVSSFFPHSLISSPISDVEFTHQHIMTNCYTLRNLQVGQSDRSTIHQSPHVRLNFVHNHLHEAQQWFLFSDVAVTPNISQH